MKTTIAQRGRVKKPRAPTKSWLTARSRSEFTRLEELPNVGPSIADDLRQLGVRSPQDLVGRDPFAMYDELCRLTGQRHDLCLLDVFIAAVRFMGGESARPWWKYTAQRKRQLESRRDQ
jgi:hypothetical protein